MNRLVSCLAAAGILGVAAPGLRAQEEASAEELAKKLSNPVAALISVPLQLNWDDHIGPTGSGSQLRLNIQPVIPVSLSDDWNLISRTIVPLVSQDDIFPGAGSQWGLGDTTQSLFFSPKQPAAGGLIWGVGPVIGIPTATDDLLGSDQWTLGPTVVVLTMHGKFTFGALASHSWSVGGSASDPDIDLSFLQPFVSYVTPTAWSFSLNTEATYNWETSDWGVPLNLMVSKTARLGQKQMASIGGGVRYWLEPTDTGPEDWGLRFVLTLLYPK